MHNKDKQLRLRSFEVHLSISSPEKRWHLKQNGVLSQNKQNTKNVVHLSTSSMNEVNFLFNVTIYDISVIYVTAHRCAGGLKKKLNLRSGSQRHRHFAGFFNVPVQTPTRDHPFYTVIPTHRPI